MWLGTLILKNLFRRPMRSALTVVAIAIAIGAVVALFGVAQGSKDSATRLYEDVGIDLVVVRSGGQQRLNSHLDENLGDKIKVIPGVVAVLPGLVDLLSFEKLNVDRALVNGFIPETEVFSHFRWEDGRPLQTSDTKAAVLGSILAKNMGKGVGDEIEIVEGEIFKVVGVYSTYSVIENGSLVVPLKEMQRFSDRPGQVTGFSLVLTPDAKKDIPRVKSAVEALAKNIKGMPTKDHVASLGEIRLVNAIAWLTSSVALVIGLFGMMNTMVMTVHERTREIGILRAVGWRPGRVMRLILLESVVLCICGATLGILGAAGLLKLLTKMPRVNGFVEGKLEWWLIGMAMLIAVGVGLLGGIIPALRAARMTPTEALRQE